MSPEDNPAADVQPTEEEWNAYELATLRLKAISAANRMRANNREVHRLMMPHADEQKLWDESTDWANVMARYILAMEGGEK